MLSLGLAIVLNFGLSEEAPIIVVPSGSRMEDLLTLVCLGVCLLLVG